MNFPVFRDNRRLTIVCGRKTVASRRWSYCAEILTAFARGGAGETEIQEKTKVAAERRKIFVKTANTDGKD